MILRNASLLIFCVARQSTISSWITCENCGGKSTPAISDISIFQIGNSPRKGNGWRGRRLDKSEMFRGVGCWFSQIAWSTFTFSRALESFVWVRKIKAIVMGSKEREWCHVANQSLHNNNCLFSCNEGLYLSNVELRVVRLAQSSELCLLR